MSALTKDPSTTSTLPALIQAAASKLASATTAAEVLEACASATFAYDTAKAAARFGRAKQAHDEVLSAVYRAQADALIIEAQAKCRLADEYDAAQERGEVRTQADNQHVLDENKHRVADIGLTRKAVHEARQIRDAEAADSGIVQRTVEAAVDRGYEPTRAEVRRAIDPAAASRRAPITHDTGSFVVDLSRVCKRADKLLQDTRLDVAMVASRYGPELLRAFESLTQWIEVVANPAAGVSPEALQWWKGMLTETSETLARLADSLGGEK